MRFCGPHSGPFGTQNDGFTGPLKFAVTLLVLELDDGQLLDRLDIVHAVDIKPDAIPFRVMWRRFERLYNSRRELGFPCLLQCLVAQNEAHPECPFCRAQVQDIAAFAFEA